jgi:hypothetical protein
MQLMTVLEHYFQTERKEKFKTKFFINLVHLNLVNEEIIINATSEAVLLVSAATWLIYQVFSFVNEPSSGLYIKYHIEKFSTK